MITMFDSVDVGQIPSGAGAVAGYVNGRWPTYSTLVKRFPKAHVLSIAVASYADAECLDVERGDATISVAPSWVKRQQARGVRLPVVYTSVAQAQQLLNALAAHGIRRSDVRLWTAHYTFKPHICTSECGFGFAGKADATQYTDKAFGRTLDGSLVADYFFGASKPAAAPDVRGESKADAPFTHRLWPVPVPEWFWAWAWWRSNRPDDKDAQKAWLAARPAQAPKAIPAWAWVRLAAL